MCLMILKRKNQKFEPELMEVIANQGNDDGSGYMYVQGERNEAGKLINPKEARVVVDHTMAKPSELPAWYEPVMDNNIAVHVRNQTSGDINLENCHPYCVLSKDLGHKIDLYMMHNGSIRDVQVNRRMSDSWNFATEFLRPLLAPRPSLMLEPSFIYFLCGIIGPNKLIFLDNYERFVIINEDMGSIQPSGVWASTKMEIKVPKAIAVPTNFGRPVGWGPQQQMMNQTHGSGSHARHEPGGRSGTVAWQHAEGEWEMDTDGRSHFHPKLPQKNLEGADAEATGDSPNGAAIDNGTLELTRQTMDIDEEGLRKIQADLPKMDQKAISDFVCESPIEAAELLIRLSVSDPKQLTWAEAYEMALENPWGAVNKLVHISRLQVHEVN
jgi:Glutamine amidotransferases class-II